MVHTPAATRWAAIIDRQEASGLTIRAFAEEEGVNPSTLFWWRSKLGRAQRRTPSDEASSPPEFDELCVSAEQVEGTVVVALERLDVHVVVDHDTDLDLLRQVLDALC